MNRSQPKSNSHRREFRGGLTPRGCQRWPRVFGHTSSIALPEAERTVGDREFGRDGQPAPLQVEQPSASALGIVGIGPGRDGQFGLGPAPLSGDRTRNVQCLKRRPANLCRRGRGGPTFVPMSSRTSPSRALRASRKSAQFAPGSGGLVRRYRERPPW
jgi:hypothetical protein